MYSVKLNVVNKDSIYTIAGNIKVSLGTIDTGKQIILTGIFVDISENVFSM